MRTLMSLPHVAISGLRTHVSSPVTWPEWKCCASGSKFISSARSRSRFESGSVYSCADASEQSSCSSDGEIASATTRECRPSRRKLFVRLYSSRSCAARRGRARCALLSGRQRGAELGSSRRRAAPLRRWRPHRSQHSPRGGRHALVPPAAAGSGKWQACSSRKGRAAVAAHLRSLERVDNAGVGRADKAFRVRHERVNGAPVGGRVRKLELELARVDHEEVARVRACAHRSGASGGGQRAQANARMGRARERVVHRRG